MVCAIAVTRIGLSLFVERWRSLEVAVVVGLLRLRGAGSVHRAGDQILVFGGVGHTFSAVVGTSCSSLLVVLAFATFAAIVSRGDRHCRWLAFGLGASVIVVGNLLRIAITMMVGIRSGSASIQGFHDGFAVWFAVVLVLTAFGLFVAVLSSAGNGRVTATRGGRR